MESTSPTDHSIVIEFAKAHRLYHSHEDYWWLAPVQKQGIDEFLIKAKHHTLSTSEESVCRSLVKHILCTRLSSQIADTIRASGDRSVALDVFNSATMPVSSLIAILERRTHCLSNHGWVIQKNVEHDGWYLLKTEYSVQHEKWTNGAIWGEDVLGKLTAVQRTGLLRAIGTDLSLYDYNKDLDLDPSVVGNEPRPKALGEFGLVELVETTVPMLSTRGSLSFHGCDHRVCSLICWRSPAY